MKTTHFGFATLLILAASVFAAVPHINYDSTTVHYARNASITDNNVTFTDASIPGCTVVSYASDVARPLAIIRFLESGDSLPTHCAKKRGVNQYPSTVHAEFRLCLSYLWSLDIWNLPPHGFPKIRDLLKGFPRK